MVLLNSMEYDKKKPDDDIEDTGKDDIFSFILPARIFFFPFFSGT